MFSHDHHGNALSGASHTAADSFAQAVSQFAIFSGDPVGGAETLMRDEPGFVMAHALQAWLYLLGTEPAGIPVARQTIERALKLPATERERGHLAALSHLSEGRWHEASRVIEDVAIANPRDLLALIAGHQLDFFTGHARLLKNRIARALPAWSPEMASHHAMLGMHAFGLEENGEYTLAESQGRAALAAAPADGWARHAVAHVLEMQGRHDEGIAFMRDDIATWTQGSFLAVHNWWHLALYHLELGEIDEVLALVDGPICGGLPVQMLELVDASAMLWRLHLRGIDVGDRWTTLVERYQATWSAGLYAFNDLHALMAFIGAGRQDLVEAVLAQQPIAALSAGDNAGFTQDVGYPLMRAFAAFGEGRYAEAVRLIRPVRHIAARFGGSNAQRDVIELTLIEAALRAGDEPLARALAGERLAAKHESPLARLFAQRSGLTIAGASQAA